MSPNYWIRISFGALAVFAVGFLLFRTGEGAATLAHEVAHSDATISIPLAFIPFRFAGEKIGAVKRLDLYRDAPDHVREARVTVRLEETEADAVPACRLTVDDLDNFDDASDFRCAEWSTTPELLHFGTVMFEPQGISRELLLPRDVVRELTNGYEAYAPQVPAASGTSSPAYAPDAAQDAGAEIALQANRHGVMLSIVDALNEAGLVLKADSDGAVLTIKDAPGSTGLSLRADSLGFAVSVKENNEGALQMRADSNGLILNVRDGAAQKVVKVETQ